MPITLTTAWNPGQFDPGNTYPKALIAAFMVDTEKGSIQISVDFGDIVNAKWASGGAPGKVKHYLVTGASFTEISSTVPDEGETIYDCIKRVLYEYLVEHIPELAGTVV